MASLPRREPKREPTPEPGRPPTLTVAPPLGGAAVTTGVALVLHGGRSRSTTPTNGRNLTVLRMVPFARSLQRAGGHDGLAVARLRYGVRGWNGPAMSPVSDARWALEQLRDRFGDVPVALVGHSMGGRTALYVAGDPAVTAVVGLAPWIEPGDPVDQLAGRRVLLAHGTHDRMTSAAASARYARQAASVARSISYVSVNDERHAMLRRAGVWHDLATGFVMGVLYDRLPDETTATATTNVLANALAGQPSLAV